MADYFEKVAFHTNIPVNDMTELEFFLLSQIFEHEDDDGQVYFYAEDSPASSLSAARGDLVTNDVRTPGNTAQEFVDTILNPWPDDARSDDIIDFDVDGELWRDILLDIVKRSKSLTHIAVQHSYSCSRMRPDGFGSAVTLITKDEILTKSTNSILTGWLEERRLTI